MSAGTARRSLRRVVAASAALGALTLVVAPPLPAAAAARPARAAPAAGRCARARTQWARLVTANKRAKTAFQRAQTLQARLVKEGRTRLGHRLDTRLQYLQQVHALLVARVDAIATRVHGVCADRPPTLDSF